jgi:hypothetical protein
MAWLLETIRATVFAPDIKALGLSDWQTLMKARPRQTRSNPEADSTLEAGPFGNHWLTIGLARRPSRGPGRADFILAPPQSTVVVPLGPEQERIESAAIGPFTTTIPPFIEIARRWLSTDSHVTRLALACTLWERTSTYDEALDIVLRNVPSFKKVGDDRITDFLIQLNRPRTSRVNPSMTINRFAQWSARTVEILLTLRPIFPPPIIRYTRAQTDLDIGTAGDSDMAGREIPVYLEEFRELLVEIAEKGDAP